MARRLTEKRVWDNVRRRFPPSASLSRIESHSTSVGFPDVEYMVDGVSGTIELKVTDDWDTVVKIRPTQIGWHRKRRGAGGNPWFLIWVHHAREYALVGGDLVDELLETKTIPNGSIRMTPLELNNHFVDILRGDDHGPRLYLGSHLA